MQGLRVLVKLGVLVVLGVELGELSVTRVKHGVVLQLMLRVMGRGQM